MYAVVDEDSLTRKAVVVKGFEAIPALLNRAGIPVVFSMLGGTNVPWIAAGERAGTLRLVKTRHEETAVNAAAGYAKATAGLGVCSVTRGPGFANAVNAMVATGLNHLPVMLIVGESPTAAERTTQQLDQKGLSAIVGAGFHHAATGAEFEGVFWSAYRAAMWDGTLQVLSMADQVLSAEVSLSAQGEEDRDPAHPVPDPEVLDRVALALRQAERPLLLAGQGAALAHSHQTLVELAELSGSALATSLVANRFFSGHRQDLGLCGGWAPSRSRKLIQSADVIVSFGASLNGFTTDLGRVFDSSASVIVNDVAPADPVLLDQDVLLVRGDAATVARGVLERWRAFGLAPREPWAESISFAQNKASVLEAEIGYEPTGGIDPREVFEAIDRIFPVDRVVAGDSGRAVGGSMPSVVDAPDAESFLIGNSFSSIGRGLGIAIGAAVAHEGRPVVLFAGDGGFAMTLHDLDAVRLAGLDLTIVIMNDEQYGSEVKHLDKYDLPLDVIAQPLPDVPKLAEAFGGEGYVVTDLAQLDEVGLPRPGLVILDVRIDSAADVRRSVGF